MSSLFDYNINYQSDCRNQTELPFQLFGMSQQGKSHHIQSIGNQDAGSVFVGKKILIGVVSDGCSQGKNINGFSSNQVGAQIACNLSVKVIRRLIQRKRLNIEDFKVEYEFGLTRQYKRVFNAFSPWKNERKIILSNLFSATFVVFVVTASKFVVFHYGDGWAFINSDEYNLISDGSQYFTNRLFDQQSKSKNIKYLKSGHTKDLNNLLIATDGFIDSRIHQEKQFKNFFFNSTPLIHQVGFADRKAEFRMEVLKKSEQFEKNNSWSHDDATFISLQRVPSLKSNN